MSKQEKKIWTSNVVFLRYKWDVNYFVMKLDGKALFIMQSYHPCAKIHYMLTLPD